MRRSILSIVTDSCWYAGPAVEKEERERLAQLAKPKAALKPPVYAPEVSTVVGEPISKQVGHSLDGACTLSCGLADSPRHLVVRAGRPAGAASLCVIPRGRINPIPSSPHLSAHTRAHPLSLQSLYSPSIGLRELSCPSHCRWLAGNLAQTRLHCLWTIFGKTATLIRKPNEVIGPPPR